LRRFKRTLKVLFEGEGSSRVLVDSVMTIIIFLVIVLFNLLPDLAYFISITIFGLEYVLRLWIKGNKLKYIFSFAGVVDLVCIFVPVLPGEYTEYVLLLKIFRYSKFSKTFAEVFWEKLPELLSVLALALILVVVISVIVYHFESGVKDTSYRSLWDAIWWGIVTLTTVGYGDMYPQTNAGRAFAVIAMFLGIGVISIPTGIISAGLVEKIMDKKLRGKLDLEDHVVFLGYNDSFNRILQEEEIQDMTAVVLITKKDVNVPAWVLHYKEDYLSSVLLEKLNLNYARAVVVLSEREGEEDSVDAKSMLTAITVRKMAPDVHIVLELLRDENIKVAKEILRGVDVVAQSKLIGEITIASIVSPGISDVFSELMSIGGSDLILMGAEELGVDEPELFDEFMDRLHERGILPIGIKRGEEVILVPDKDFHVISDDEVFVVKRG